MKNNYKEKELDKFSTTEDFSVVQLEGKREVPRNVTCPELDQLNRIQNLHLSGGDSSIEEKQYSMGRKLSSGFHPKAAGGLI